MESPPNEEHIFLRDIPIKALTHSTRTALAQKLDPEQLIMSRNNFSRDHRGLAQQIGFNYEHLNHFTNSGGPTLTILVALEENDESCVLDLLNFLEAMERYDIKDDILPELKKDAKEYLRKTANSSLQEAGNYSIGESINFTTVDEVGDYDVYVCYADENLDIVNEIVNQLEIERGVKLFIKERDLLPGSLENSELTELITNRCRRMLIVLSEEFTKSNECTFFTDFALTLSMETRKRVIIPMIIAEHVVIPNVIRPLSKLNFFKPDIQPWAWDRLMNSILDNIITPNVNTVHGLTENKNTSDRKIEFPHAHHSDFLALEQSTQKETLPNNEIERKCRTSKGTFSKLTKCLKRNFTFKNEN